MSIKNNLIKVMKNKVFGCFFAIFLMLSSLFGTIPGTTENVYAEPVTTQTTGATCEDSLGSLGWLVCPSTGKISEAVDFLYDKIEGVLKVNPVRMEDGAPIYEIWKYFQGVTNVLFIVFLMVMVFSQVSGVGITNYGIKKALPKLVIAAILVNLSFYICSLAVDVSNIFGEGIRGMFESIEASTSANMEGVATTGVGMSEMYTALAGGVGLGVMGLAVAAETGAIWMLIPLALGGLVSVVIGLVTIAMRQAVVTLLIMVAPLAMVAYILPNTEVWFKKWKNLLFQMLIFYPAFSLLFGASSVAGWAIIVSSQDNGFGILLGIAVQIFPLFFSWSLMKMSGTFLGTINSKLNALASKPLMGVRAWAGSHQELTKQRNLAAKNAYTPSMKLQQFLSDRKIAREEETREHAETVKNRGLAYAADRNYNRRGLPTKEGVEAYEAQARNAEYQSRILRHKNNMNKGLGALEAVKKNGTLSQKAILNNLDNQNVRSFDKLKMEQARGEVIDYNNAAGFHTRMEDAMNAHMDALQRSGKLIKNGKPVSDTEYKYHFANSGLENEAMQRYNTLANDVMEGNVADAQYAIATAAHGYDTQAKIVATKMQKYFELAPPTQDVVYRLNEWTKQRDAARNIDAIVSGLKVLNMRGDTDLVKEQLYNLMDKDLGGGIQLGTHASQALASFLMFDVKGSDPWLRRFGKYINLETANVYNKNSRKVLDITYDEYIKGFHEEPYGTLMYSKKDMPVLMEGTSLDDVERTAYSSIDESLRKAYTYKEGDKEYFDVDGYLKRREEMQKAIGPQFISASLKYLSGSEQLVNAVKFLTGYSKEQKKDENGKVMLDNEGKPIYEWVAVWDKYKNAKYKINPDKLRDYYNKKTLEYITDQTPSQILSMRSDYFTPIANHLTMAYKNGPKMDGWTDEKILEHEEYMKELSDIQTRYGDLPPDEAKRKREADMRQLDKKMAGAEFRQLLDSKGILNQIYRTRRSGAANNAKGWLREWLDLDNETAINLKLEEDKRREKAEFEKARRERDGASGDSPDADGEPSRIYTDVDMASFVRDIDDLWHDLRDDDDAFYRDSLEYIEKALSKDSFIAALYRQFRKNDPYADSYTLKQFLEDILNDPENY